MQLTQTNLRYLLAIYEAAQTEANVSSRSIAQRMQVTKSAVTGAIKALMQQGMIVKKMYGKIYLTGVGVLTAKYYDALVEHILHDFPRVGMVLTEAERRQAAVAMAAALPNHPLQAKIDLLYAAAADDTDNTQEGANDHE